MSPRASLIFYLMSIIITDLSLQEEQEEDLYEDDFDLESGENFDDYDYDGDIDNLDYEALKQIEDTLNNIQLDSESENNDKIDEELEQYNKMKKMRASIHGLVDEETLADMLNKEHDLNNKMAETKTEL